MNSLIYPEKFILLTFESYIQLILVVFLPLDTMMLFIWMREIPFQEVPYSLFLQLSHFKSIGISLYNFSCSTSQEIQLFYHCIKYPLSIE